MPTCTLYIPFSGYLQTNVGIKYGVYLAGGSLCAAGLIFGAVITILFIIQRFKQENRTVDNKCPSNWIITIITNILISILLASKSSSFQRSLTIEWSRDIVNIGFFSFLSQTHKLKKLKKPIFTISLLHSIEIGRAHVWTPVTCQNLVCRLLLEKKKKKKKNNNIHSRK